MYVRYIKKYNRLETGGKSYIEQPARSLAAGRRGAVRLHDICTGGGGGGGDDAAPAGLASRRRRIYQHATTSHLTLSPCRAAPYAPIIIIGPLYF